MEQHEAALRHRQAKIFDFATPQSRSKRRTKMKNIIVITGASSALAVVYARELTRWGIETSIIVPGAFTGGTNHFAHAGSPADKARVAECEAGPYRQRLVHKRELTLTN
jgi:hypothetical protein